MRHTQGPEFQMGDLAAPAYAPTCLFPDFPDPWIHQLSIPFLWFSLQIALGYDYAVTTSPPIPESCPSLFQLGETLPSPSKARPGAVIYLWSLLWLLLEGVPLLPCLTWCSVHIREARLRPVSILIQWRCRRLRLLCFVQVTQPDNSESEGTKVSWLLIRIIVFCVYKSCLLCWVVGVAEENFSFFGYYQWNPGHCF